MASHKNRVSTSEKAQRGWQKAIRLSRMCDLLLSFTLFVSHNDKTKTDFRKKHDTIFQIIIFSLPSIPVTFLSFSNFIFPKRSLWLITAFFEIDFVKQCFFPSSIYFHDRMLIPNFFFFSADVSHWEDEIFYNNYDWKKRRENPKRREKKCHAMIYCWTNSTIRTLFWFSFSVEYICCKINVCRWICLPA